MGGSVTAETGNGRPDLVTAREPVGPKDETKAKTVGDAAFRDAVIIVIGAWAILFVLTFSLRAHNI